jgi:hypothetical protein
VAKRFTDTEKWKKNFFKNLTPAYKCFWNFITDDCDHSGIWEVEDPQIIAVRIGEKIDLATALFAFNEDEKRIHVFDGGRKWFIIPFVSFQYGDLNPNNRLHESVRRDLTRKSLVDLIPVRGPLEVVNYKEQDKDKEKDKELLEVKKPFGEEGLVLLTQEEHGKLLVKLGERKTADYITRLENYIGSKGKKYKSHYHTILSWAKNEPTTGSFDSDKNPMNLNKTQQGNMEALSDFLERKGKTGPKDIRPGDSDPIRSLPGGKV